MSEQSTNTELITKVPGMDGEAYRPVSIIESDPDQVAIALAKRKAGQQLLEVVSAEAVEAARRARSATEQ